MKSIQKELQELREMQQEYIDQKVSTTHVKARCTIYEQTHKREKLLFTMKCNQMEEA